MLLTHWFTAVIAFGVGLVLGKATRVEVPRLERMPTMGIPSVRASAPEFEIDTPRDHSPVTSRRVVSFTVARFDAQHGVVYAAFCDKDQTLRASNVAPTARGALIGAIESAPLCGDPQMEVTTGWW